MKYRFLFIARESSNLKSRQNKAHNDRKVPPLHVILVMTGGDYMDWIRGLQRAIDYMEENMTQVLDYSIIAE